MLDANQDVGLRVVADPLMVLVCSRARSSVPPRRFLFGANALASITPYMQLWRAATLIDELTQT
jgi:hypothetical protein